MQIVQGAALGILETGACEASAVGVEIGIVDPSNPNAPPLVQCNLSADSIALPISESKVARAVGIVTPSFCDGVQEDQVNITAQVCSRPVYMLGAIMNCCFSSCGNHPKNV